MVGPKLLFIRVTEACDAACFMCSFAENKSPHLFTVEKSKSLVIELKGSSIKHIRLTGGEPLLLDDIGEIVSVFKNAGFVVSIITNGMSLKKRWLDLAKAGLDQIIVSLDSPLAEMHDKLRKTKSLFANAIEGIKQINSDTSSTLIRVNTVVGKHNLKLLPQMFYFLNNLEIKQWSLIPLKPFPKELPKNFQNLWFNVREQLLWLSEKLINPKLLGNSLNLFGNNVNSYEELIFKGCPQTPRPTCGLVEWIRFLDLKTQRVFPCNCVPHRGEIAQKFGAPFSPEVWNNSALKSSRQWLKDNGPSHCTGCEPINVALGEGQIDLNSDIFGF